MPQRGGPDPCCAGAVAWRWSGSPGSQEGRKEGSKEGQKREETAGSSGWYPAQTKVEQSRAACASGEAARREGGVEAGWWRQYSSSKLKESFSASYQTSSCSRAAYCNNAQCSHQHDTMTKKEQRSLEQAAGRVSLARDKQLPLFSHLPQYERETSLSQNIGFSDVRPVQAQRLLRPSPWCHRTSPCTQRSFA